MVSHERASLRGAGRVVASLGLGGIALHRVVPAVATAVPVAALAAFTLPRVLELTGGTPAAPLDDAYIHFQFARAFARGEPLVYSPGASPVAGATSLLWPLLLSIPYALGLREHGIVWAAWAFGFIGLGLLAWEARKAAERFCSPLCAAGASALVLAFGANLWFAASGMEVVPLAWLMLRAVRRAAEWMEGEGGKTTLVARRRELLALAAASPLMRPEGALCSVLIAAVLALDPRGKSRLWSLAAAGAAAVPALSNLLLTGETASTTARAKWLLLSPYITAGGLLTSVGDYVVLLVGTLLNGKIWSALFLPSGTAPIALLSLGALLVAGHRRGVPARGALLFLLALGILVPATYDCPLCNRLRYLWPFFPAWMVGTAALAEQLGEAVARRLPEVKGVSLILVGAAAGALCGYLPFSIEDVAQSSRAIFNQQVSLGLWARDALPATARVGVNDAGALTYFSQRQTFDIVGLTTAGEASYWSAGAGSRFEHYERLGRERLPTHFIVYPEWFNVEALLGAELTSRYVPDATILGGPRMSAHVADYGKLRSAEAPEPELSHARDVIDRLDVADLESEAAHAYELNEAQQRDNVVVELGHRLDGARTERTLDAFTLDVDPAGSLVLRVAAATETALDLRVGRQRLTVEIPPSRWYETRVELTTNAGRGKVPVTVRARNGRFAALHYFSLGPPR
jgi:hypothetical protein